MADTALNDLFAKNRAEELGYDVWEHFVIPPFYDQLSLGVTNKPRVIIGGRGSGKTMLLRYLSHDSSFSASRKEISENSLLHIGLYWRADTQFTSLMQGRGIPDDQWDSAFKHLAALVLGIEFLRSLDSIANSSFRALDEGNVASLDFQRLTAIDSSLPRSARELQSYLEDSLTVFETWVNDVYSAQKPAFLPGDVFLKRMIALAEQQLIPFKDAVFFVYVDEYENLASHQQRVINTWVKHSEPPLIFNLAMKRNGFKTITTSGGESLSNLHDFRILDLDDFDLEKDFPPFAAEILLLQLRRAHFPDTPVNPDVLRDPKRLGERRQPHYITTVLEAVRDLFPSVSDREAARGVLHDHILRSRLAERVVKGLRLRKDGTPLEKLLRDNEPAASVVVGALIYRDTLSASEICEELDKLDAGLENRFTGRTNWIHNNLVGCLLLLYDGLTRPCPLFGGFTTFCKLSRGNLRHFLELCHQSIACARRRETDGSLQGVSVETQADSARKVAAELLAEVKSFGPEGHNLHSFLLRIGTLFGQGLRIKTWT